MMSERKNINWDEQPLGEMTDTELANKLGVNPCSVNIQRRKRGIKPFLYNLNGKRKRGYNKTPDGWIGIGEASDILGIKKGTLYSWVYWGHGPQEFICSMKKDCGKILLKRDYILRFKDEYERVSPKKWIKIQTQFDKRVLGHLHGDLTNEPIVCRLIQYDKLCYNIDDAELSRRTYNCLKNSGFVTVGDVVVKTEMDLIKIKNFGRKSLKELRDFLYELGLHLGMKIGCSKTQPPGR